ncbi:MAG: CHRD domain-containing protein [Micromonosporaceae bacterium]|nr:CHRD domain-containing protein [Micromonosporaceae bacterium]
MRTKILSAAAAVVAVGAAGIGAGLAAAHRPASGTPAAWVQPKDAHGAAGLASFVQPDGYAFQTVDDKADPTFNQLLGINNDGVIAGYFGSGAQGQPNKGYTVRRNGSVFQDENFPGSVQTQVTGLNNSGVTVGFMSSMNNADAVNDNIGWYAANGRFHRVAFPTADNANPPVNQLLGVNDGGTAVGFYVDAAGNSHGYTFDINRGRFHTVALAGATSGTAAAVNDRGDVAGFFTGADGVTSGFLQAGGRTTVLSYPNATATQALGVNDNDEVVGVYQTGTGAGAQMHGFTWTVKQSFLTVDDPNGTGTTTINGVNDAGTLVGFYVDGGGNTHGLLASVQHTPATRHLTLNPMPQGSVTLSRDAQNNLVAHLTAFGFTPGSSHTVEIDAPGRSGPVVRLGTVAADGTGQIDQRVTAMDAVGSLPSGSQLVIRLGADSGDPVASEPIARTVALPKRPSSDDATPLMAVDVNPDGVNQGRPHGKATLVYDAAAHTITITVSASGLTPGAHAAHIHNGSCRSQGGVAYMLTDLIADGQGNVSQTQTIDGVTSVPPAGSWYLNVHQGDMNSILSGGTPALPFRPLLCANI